MADDKMKMHLDFDIQVEGQKKLEKTDQTIARLTANLEKIAALGKAAGSVVSGFSFPGRGNSGSTASTRNTTRALRDQLGIDREKLRVAKMAIRYRQTEAAQAIRAAQAQERQARQAFRDKLTFNSRLAAQRLREDNAALRAVRSEQRAVERSFRQKMSFATRMANQRAREEVAAEREIQRGIRESGRLRQAEARRALADSRALQRERSRGMSQIGRGAGRVRDGARTAIGVGAAAGAVTAYTGQRAVRAVTTDASDLDAAMNRNARMQPELGGSKYTAPLMQALRRKFMPIAASIGRTTTEMFNTRAELLQAGLSAELADRAAEEVSKFASINEMDPAKVASDFGYGIQVLGLNKNEDVSKLLNIAQYMAANSPASREQLSSFMKRGLGNGRALNMSLEDTVAYGAAATSAGSDGESAARMLGSDSMNIAANAAREDAVRRKHTKNEQDRAFLSAPSRLGFRDWQHLKQSMDLGSADTLSQIYDRIGGAGSPMEKMQLVEQVFGKNFGSVHLGMAESGGFRKMRGIASDPKAARALEDGLEELRTTLGFAILRITNTVKELSASLGMVLKPLWQQAADWTTKLSAGFDNFKEAFAYGVKGLLYGLGSQDGSLTSLLTEAFGNPAEMRMNIDAVFRLAHAFGQGIRSVVDTIKSVFSSLSVLLGASSPAEVGKLVAQFIGFATVLTIMAPAALVIGAFSRGLLGLIEVIVGGARLVAGVGAGATVAGAAGGGGAAAAAGGAGAAAAAAQAGKWSGGLGALGLAGLAYTTKELSGYMAGIVDNAIGTDPKAALSALGAHRFGFKSGGILGYGADYLTGGNGGVFGAISQLWGGDNGRNLAGAKIDEQLAATKKAAEEAATVEHKLLEEGNKKTQELIDTTKAKDAADKSRQIAEDQKRKADAMLTGIRNAAMTGSVGSGSSAADDLRARGFNVVSPNTTPNGQGNMPRAQGGGGSATSNPANSAASAAMLDAIAGTESGRAGYDAVLGNGKYGTPSKPITQMSLDEAFAFGRQIRARHGSSSALGRYQIVGSTMRAAQRAMNIPGNATFDQAMQDRMARWIARNQGLGAWEGLKGNPTAMARARAALAQGGAQDAPAGGGSSGGSAGAPGTTDGRSVPRMTGTLTMDGQTYQYGSGGHRGANSIPAGVYPITPNAIGPWGRQHGAIGLNGNRIWDSALGRFREGIEMHSASSASMLSAGCLAINKQQWAQFRAQTLDFVKRNGKAYLKVDSNGNASITAEDPRQTGAQAGAKTTTDLAKNLNKAPTAGKGNLGEIDVAPPMRDQWGNALGQSTPTRSGGGGLGQNTPTRNGPGGRNGDAGSGGGMNIGSVHITVPGAGDPKAVANAVNSELRSRTMARAHDIDPTAV